LPVETRNAESDLTSDPMEKLQPYERMFPVEEWS
jgi:hypothetical protein